MTDSDPARPDRAEDRETDEEAAVRRETEAARARAEAEIEAARKKGHKDA
jgi:hypothetical protein